MKIGFKDPIARTPAKKRESPWDFRCPPYDERSSWFVNAGTHQGIGSRNPVGHTGAPKQRVGTLPYGKVNPMDTDHVPPKQLNIEEME